MTETKENSKLLISIISLVVGLWVISALIMYFLINKEFRGEAGDMFGAVNALFSGLAFAGIIFTIHIQRKELALQRKELALQREATNNSTKELAGQREVMILQRIENTLFNMINLHHGIISAMEYDRNYKGRIVILQLYNRMKSSFNTSEKLSVEEVFRRVYDENRETLSHYFNHVISIIGMVDTYEELETHHKSRYVGIFLAQLSEYELVLINHYVSTEYLKSMLQKYNFDDYINKDLLLRGN